MTDQLISLCLSVTSLTLFARDSQLEGIYIVPVKPSVEPWGMLIKIPCRPVVIGEAEEPGSRSIPEP
ncbi:hypothetical protein IG631_05480 [Alternaria alternata]|nr:hypothetical protein IG631_05480 [Alternaria alternata]